MPGLYNRFPNKHNLAPYDHYYSAVDPPNPDAPPQTLGLPVWLFHPIEAAKCWINFVVTEIEEYSVLPLTLIGGGFIIYYLRKTPSY
jgi:hypothetical protein